MLQTMETGTFTIELAQRADCCFEARFDNPALPTLVTDEPRPLGADSGPDPARLLGTAVANCLAASLLFALRKFRIDMEPLRAAATVAVRRNAQNRLRIGRISVDLHLERAEPAKANSCAACSTSSKSSASWRRACRAGIPIDVRVIDRNGVVLTQPETTGEPA